MFFMHYLVPPPQQEHLEMNVLAAGPPDGAGAGAGELIVGNGHAGDGAEGQAGGAAADQPAPNMPMRDAVKLLLSVVIYPFVMRYAHRCLSDSLFVRFLLLCLVFSRI